MPTPDTVGDNEGLYFGTVNVRSSEQSQDILKRVLAARGAPSSQDAHYDSIRADINALNPERVAAMNASTEATINELLSAAGNDAEGVDEVAA